MAASAEAVFEGAELIVKVKELQPQEVELLTPDHPLFTYLHLAAASELARSLCASGATCIACETVEGAAGSRPLLAPMSEVAGNLAPQVGFGAITGPTGRGVLPGDVPGSLRL